MHTWSEALFNFYRHLQPPRKLPAGVEWLYPQQQPEVMDVVKRFLDKYYNDHQPRKLMLGINPGRFGAGITGVNFTAARQLTEECCIDHPFKQGSELSAEFIYEAIRAFGGPGEFYSRFFISSVCPLGFVKGGKNINYYDDKELQKAVEPFIIENMERLLLLPVDRSRCICIGGEKNYRYFSALNEKKGWFENVTSVPHPRFIMQYKRKQKEEYVRLYLEELNKNN
jgi:hypothetical protein